VEQEGDGANLRGKKRVNPRGGGDIMVHSIQGGIGNAWEE